MPRPVLAEAHDDLDAAVAAGQGNPNRRPGTPQDGEAATRACLPEAAGGGRVRRTRRVAALLCIVSAFAACGRSSFPVALDEPDDEVGVPLLDLVERADYAPVRLSHAGEHFDGGDGETSDGWSAPQRIVASGQSIAWVMGRRATVRVDLDDRTVRWLHLRCQAAPSDNPATQRMTVALDEWELGVVDLAANRFDVHSFRLPRGAAARDSVVVALAFSHTAPSIVPIAASGNSAPSTPGGRSEVAAACDYLALTADGEPPELWQTSRVLGEYGPRGGGRLFQPSGSEVAFPLSVPIDGRLEFGVREDAESGNREGTLRAIASIRRQGHAEATFFNEVIPTSGARWRADLSSIAGEDVQIVFRIAGGDSRRRGAEWFALRVHGDPGGREPDHQRRADRRRHPARRPPRQLRRRRAHAALWMRSPRPASASRMPTVTLP